MSEENLKKTIREKYESVTDDCGCGTTSCCGDDELTNFADSYEGLEGYQEEADLGLGCGLPTKFANIQPGDTVVDLGSGAGNDVFIAMKETGEQGYVIGVDMVKKMIDKARRNAEKIDAHNVDFRLGEIEDLPIETDTADVVLSNCVMNLVPEKTKAFGEVYRILNPGGRFSISDIVHEGEMPDSLLEDADAYAGCVSGSLPKQKLLDIINDLGFENLTIESEKEVPIPEQMVQRHLGDEEMPGKLLSVTLTAHKPQ